MTREFLSIQTLAVEDQRAVGWYRTNVVAEAERGIAEPIIILIIAAAVVVPDRVEDSIMVVSFFISTSFSSLFC